MRVPESLRNRQFRLLWLGLMVSQTGSQMQVWALLWHVRVLSKLPIALGLVGLARFLPIIVFSLIAGTVADSHDRRIVMFWSQATMAATSLALALLTFTHHIVVWELYLLTAISAIALSFDSPARQSIIPNLVPSAQLPSAFSMISMGRQLGAVSGPALSGAVIAYWGQGYTYLLNTCSFGAVLFALARMGPISQTRSQPGRHGVDFRAIAAGIRFVRGSPIILSTMLIDFFATFFSTANALLPIFVVDIFLAGELQYGWLSAGQALGAIVASLFLTQLSFVPRPGLLFLASVLLYGLATIAFGFSHSVGWALISLVVIGASDAVSTILRNTMRQMQTPDEMRGRMVSINQIFFIGGPQLGELEAGFVAQFAGAPFAVISGGIACVCAVLWTAHRWPFLARYGADERRRDTESVGS
jgi:MFS family permease